MSKSDKEERAPAQNAADPIRLRGDGPLSKLYTAVAWEAVGVDRFGVGKYHLHLRNRFTNECKTVMTEVPSER